MNLFSKIFIALSILGFSACNETGSSSENADSLSVKKMSTDSNSEMPIQTPSDSTAKMPNAYDSTKK